MATKRLTALDMTLTEIQNVLLQLIAGNPGSPTEGQIWYDSTAKKLKYRTNTANVDPTDRINHTGTQTAATVSDLATVVKAYRLDEFAAPNANLNINSKLLTFVLDPVSPQDAATKNYVDGFVNGVDWKGSVRVATTANGTLASAFANGQVVDGITLVTGNRILIKDQTTGAQNGIYTVNASGAPTRAGDANTSAEVTTGMAVFVEEGTLNGNQQWVLTTDMPITLDTTALVFAQIGASGGAPAGGAGLTLAANTYDVVAGATPGSGGPGGGIVVNANDIVIDTTVVVRKYAVDVGTGALTSITVTHNLNTKDVVCTVFDNTTPFREVQVDVDHTTVNTLTLGFAVAPTSNQYRVVVKA